MNQEDYWVESVENYVLFTAHSFWLFDFGGIVPFIVFELFCNYRHCRWMKMILMWRYANNFYLVKRQLNLLFPKPVLHVFVNFCPLLVIPIKETFYLFCDSYFLFEINLLIEWFNYIFPTLYNETVRSRRAVVP